jgi:hypothetical protein
MEALPEKIAMLLQTIGSAPAAIMSDRRLRLLSSRQQFREPRAFVDFNTVAYFLDRQCGAKEAIFRFPLRMPHACFAPPFF